MNPRPRPLPRFALPLFALSLAVAVLAFPDAARAACPPGFSNPITSGDPAAGPPVILTGLGPAPTGYFFLLGSGDANHSGTLPASAWLHSVGDVDGDGLPDYRVDAPGQGPGGWGDPRTVGCPSTSSPVHPPLVLVITHVREDFDGDGKFDVFEDFIHRNGVLDPGEDRDGDGVLTPGNRCEGVNREDLDCDGHLDIIDEDPNGNGVCDPSDPLYPACDVDQDGHLDRGVEDRNHNQNLDDRPILYPDDHVVDENGRPNPLYPYQASRPSGGGVMVISIAWSGAAYNLQSVTTPTTLLGPAEDLDHDGAFDVFEDFIHRNGVLDPGEDRDGDGRLTPPGGCEGVNREDIDCDGHLDTIDEDPNGNGVCDPSDPFYPACDIDNDGHLDRGLEDRNHNGILDDRPFPRLDDLIYEYQNGVQVAVLPPAYPYDTLIPRPLRLLRATPLDTVVPSGFGGPPLTASTMFRVGGVHIDPQGHLRLRLDMAGVALHDDAGGARDIYSQLLLALGGPGLLPSYFVESGTPTLALPAAGNLEAGAFLSIAGTEVYGFYSPGPLVARGLSPGSETLLGAADSWPGLLIKVLLDEDTDSFIQPFDDCPTVPNYDQFIRDADFNGIGDACDPGGPLSTTVFDAWRPQGQIAPAPVPKERSAAAYDPAHGVVVLFGGTGTDDRTTWEYDGQAWRSFAPAVAPEGRARHRMVYDSARRRVVLFGGLSNATSAALSDLWEYDAGTHAWSQVASVVHPGARSDFGLAYDARREALVLFGGTGPEGALLGDTWVHAGGAWRIVPSPRSPSPRSVPRMTFDAYHEVIVLAGGDSAASPPSMNDVWEFDGATWQPADYRGNLSPSSGLSIDFDPARRQVLVMGGLPSAAVRTYDGVFWSGLPTVTPVPRMTPQVAAFDSARRILVAHGLPLAAQPGDPLTWELVMGADVDLDGVPDVTDNCPLLANADQADGDHDGTGDACDDCPLVADPLQRDLDQDRAGDACDDDRDGDGVANATDVCPDAYAPGRPYSAVLQGGGPDTDQDGIADDCDACPGDAANDADHDGVCGDRDNCPLVANPMQQDANGDGAGDACQPAVRILSVSAVLFPTGGLNARVTIGDPDGDRLSGTIAISAPLVIPEVYQHGLDPCSNAFLPDGVAGEGVVYATVPGQAPLLADVDSNFGCGDGAPDALIAIGTCASTSAAEGLTIVSINRPTPFPICVRTASADFDYVVERVDSDRVLMAGQGGALIEDTYKNSKLPRSIRITGLPAAGFYLLRVSATDGVTPEASDLRLFTWSGERTLYFNAPLRRVVPVLEGTRTTPPRVER